MKTMKVATMKPLAGYHRAPKVAKNCAVLGKCFTPVPLSHSKRCVSAHASESAGLSSAEVSRTITSLVNHGTLSTIGADGVPLGTYVTFVLDTNGFPILRLRQGAVHTANVQNNDKCTIFVHSPDQPLREVGRVTLVGKVEPIAPEEEEEVSARHRIINGRTVGVDAPHDSDLFMRFKLEKCFYVAGLGKAEAEIITADAYTAAQPDELKDDAARLVAIYNSERIEEVLRITASCMGVTPFERMHAAEFLWIDVKGVYARGETVDGLREIVRYQFNRPAIDDLDVRSLLTMAAQVAWEQDRQYTPEAPVQDVPAA